MAEEDAEQVVVTKGQGEESQTGPQTGEAHVETPSPSVEELQARISLLEKESQGKDKAISRLSREPEWATSLRQAVQKIPELDARMSALARFALQDEVEAEPLPPNRYQLYEQEVAKSRPQPSTTERPMTLEEAKASGEIDSALEMAGIDQKAIPEAWQEAAQLWYGGYPKESAMRVKKGIRDYQATQQETSKAELARRKEMAAAAGGPQIRSSGGTTLRFTPKQIADMPLAEYIQRKAEIDKAAEAGNIK